MAAKLGKKRAAPSQLEPESKKKRPQTGRIQSDVSEKTRKTPITGPIRHESDHTDDEDISENDVLDELDIEEDNDDYEVGEQMDTDEPEHARVVSKSET